jgi:hypothetical protein
VATNLLGVNERHCASDNMSTNVKVQCNCNYKCGRLDRGFDMVCERTRKRHSKFDADGKLCAGKFVVNRGLPSRAIVTSIDAQGCSAPHGGTVQVSRQTQWRDKQGQLYWALVGGGADANGRDHGNADGHYLPDYMEVDENGMPPPMQYGIHILPRIKLPLDEAIYRETWKMQAVLDQAKAPQELQDVILKKLFGGKKGRSCPSMKKEDDFTGFELGELLRHAGPSWDGGIHGKEALLSFKGLCSTFDQYGMPKTQRWRMCLGSQGKWHSPEVLPPSRQDDYNLSSGVKCHCTRPTLQGPKKRVVLARDCQHCSERCPYVECGKARRDMIRFHYFPIGPMLQKLCSSRSVCHELQAMWRDKQNWFGQDPKCRSKPIYKEWWHGSRACSLSYFWDSAQTFELPVLCRKCFRCYATLPNKCAELCDPLNWNELVQEYDLQCTDCGARVTAKQEFSKVSNIYFHCYCIYILKSFSNCYIGSCKSCFTATP